MSPALFAVVVICLAAVAIFGLARIGMGTRHVRNMRWQHQREIALVTLFAPGIAKVQDDPRALLTWQPLAKTLRSRFAAEFAALDAASGSTFPFNKELLASAHARWTTEWLAWEKAHDATCKLKALVAQQELQGDVGSAVGRAKLEAIDREKLELYQRRYEEYVRVGRALQALIAVN